MSDVIHSQLVNTPTDRELHLPGFTAANSTAMLALTGMVAGDLCFKEDDSSYWSYSGTAWAPFGSGVPYSGAVGPVDLNDQNLVDVGSLAVGSIPPPTTTDANIGSVSTDGQGLFLLVGHQATEPSPIYQGVSSDGINFYDFIPNPTITPTSPIEYEYDPDIIYWNGLYWLCMDQYETHPLNNNHAIGLGISSSPDLVHWTKVVNISFPGQVWVWAPNWFIDPADGSVHIYIPCEADTTDNNFKIYELHPTNAGMTTWSTPLNIGLGTNKIDPWMVYRSGTYYLFYKDETAKYICLASSSSPTGEFSIIKTGDWAGWGDNMEAPCVVQIDSSRWRIYMQGGWYSDSIDNWATWSEKANITTACSALSNPAEIQGVCVIRLQSINALRNIVTAAFSDFQRETSGLTLDQPITFKDTVTFTPTQIWLDSGVVNLSGGIATVNSTAAANGMKVFLSCQDLNVLGTPRLDPSNIVPGVSFQINSTGATDDGKVFW